MHPPLPYTPRPWVASDVVVCNAPTRTIIRQRRWRGRTIADLGEALHVERPDAVLLEHAPDMYVALRALLHGGSVDGKTPEDYARDLLARMERPARA